MRRIHYTGPVNAVTRAKELMKAAAAHEAAGRYREAGKLCRRAVSVLQRAGAGKTARRWLLRSLNALACVLQAEGRHAETEPILKEAIAVAEEVFGPEHLEVSTPLNNLAVSFKYLARYSEAGQLYQRALLIIERALGPDHPEVATIFHNLGGLEHAAGNYARGEPFARLAVRIRRRALGPNHPDVAADVAALAAILDRQSKYEEARRLYRRALGIFERVYGPEHYEIAVNLNNLAAIDQAQGRHEDAERLYRRALTIKEKCLGPDHPDVAFSLNNLAVLLKSRRRYLEAEPLYRRAIELFERACGPEHPNVAACLENYGRLLRRMKRPAEARECEQRAAKIFAKVETLGEHAPAVTATINQRFAPFRLSVRPSAIHRWGVFADESIPAGRKVIEYTGERISRREAGRRAAGSLSYLFALNESWWVDGAVGGSGAEYINHSCDPNLRAQPARGHVLYVSKRRIEAGEELTVDYQFLPDDRKIACQCGASNCRGTINLSAEQWARLRQFKTSSMSSESTGGRSM